MKKKKSSLQVWRQVFARGVRLGAKGVNWLAPEVHISWGGAGACSPERFKRLHLVRFEGCALFRCKIKHDSFPVAAGHV